MPISSEILHAERIVLTIVSGYIDDEICVKHELNLANNPEFDPGFNQLVDVTGIQENNVTDEGLSRIADATPFLPTCRRAYVVSDNMTAAKAGFFARLAGMESDKIFVSNSREQAYTWLLGS